MTTALRSRGAGLLAFLLLPLSALPFVALIPRIVGDYQTFVRDYLERDPIPAPELELSAEQLARWQPLSVSRHAIPVIVYHGVNDDDDHYSVSQETFAEQMAMLAAAGFETIGPEQYARFIAGEAEGLPARPILITFDDARLDSFRGADAVLKRHDFRATMFVIPEVAQTRHPFYSHWNELKAMAHSGRWDIQQHAGEGHYLIPSGPGGMKAPYYANRRYEGGGQYESWAEYRERVISDLDRGRDLLLKHFPDFRLWTFAVPFGEYGQNNTNDPRIPAFMRAELSRRFDAVFTQNNPRYTTPGTPAADLRRYEIYTDTSADDLYRWLRTHQLPRPSETEGDRDVRHRRVHR
jgi:peptidoglycan/xylan/chitin deacetylase (PgdA/CDA1 family)